VSDKIDRKIQLHSIDDGNDGYNCYCCILLEWSDKAETWFNTGIVVRDIDPIMAMKRVIKIATSRNLWK